MSIFQRHPALFWGLGITILFLGMGIFRAELIDTLEFKLYDVMLNLRTRPESLSDIVLVDIDGGGGNPAKSRYPTWAPGDFGSPQPWRGQDALGR